MEQKMQFEHQLDPEGYCFSNPDPYAKPEPLSPDRAERRFFWGEDGHIHVKNLSAFWIPELTVTEVIHGTTYVVTGSYACRSRGHRKCAHPRRARGHGDHSEHWGRSPDFR